MLILSSNSGVAISRRGPPLDETRGCRGPFYRFQSSLDAVRAVTNDFFQSTPHIEENIARCLHIDSREAYNTLRFINKRCASDLSAPSALRSLANDDHALMSDEQARLLLLPDLEGLDRFKSILANGNIKLRISRQKARSAISITQCVGLGEEDASDIDIFIKYLKNKSLSAEYAPQTAQSGTLRRAPEDPAASVRVTLRLIFNDDGPQAMRWLLQEIASFAPNDAYRERRLLAAVLYHRARRISDFIEEKRGVRPDPTKEDNPMLLLTGRLMEELLSTNGTARSSRLRHAIRGAGKQHKRESSAGRVSSSRN